MEAKKEIKKRKQYEQHQLKEAVAAVKQGMSVRQAAIKFGVPRRTVGDHASGKIPHFHKSGLPPMLTDEEEEALVEYIQYMASRNMPLKRNDLRGTILELIKCSGPDRVLTSRFNLENGPSDDWFQKFLRRHNNLKWAVPQTISSQRQHQSSEYIMDDFFNKYEQLLQKLKLQDKPKQIYNCDETGISGHVATREKAYGRKGMQLHQKKISNIDHITSMTCVSADGKVLPNFLIYAKNFPTVSIEENLPKSWIYARSENGYMDKELFKTWFCDLFLKNCGSARPVLLLLDNHESRYSYNVLKAAKDNEVEILAFPPHTTHLLQPLDVGVFGHIKKSYNSICLTAGLRSSRSVITRSSFPLTWRCSIERGASEAVVKNAFKRTGLYPFNPTEVDSSKIKKSTVISNKSDLGNVTQITSVPHPNSGDTSAEVGGNCESTDVLQHPVEAIRKLPKDLEAAFPIPYDGSGPTVTKKRRINPTARYLTGSHMMGEVKIKDEQIMQKNKAKEERILKRNSQKKEMKKAIKPKGKKLLTHSSSDDDKLTETSKSDIDNHKSDGNQGQLQCTTPSVSGLNSAPASVPPENIEEVVDINNDICYVCMKEYPPVKGKGKRLRKKVKVDWVGCDACGRWFHCECINLKLKNIGNTFVCNKCTKHVYC